MAQASVARELATFVAAGLMNMSRTVRYTAISRIGPDSIEITLLYIVV